MNPLTLTLGEYLGALLSAFGAGLSLCNLLWMNHRLPKEPRKKKSADGNAKREDR